MTQKGVFWPKKSKKIFGGGQKKFDPKNFFFVTFLIFFKKLCHKNRKKRSRSSRDIAISKSSDLIGRERFSQEKAKNGVFPGKQMVQSDL